MPENDLPAKQILADALAAYRTLRPDAGHREIAVLDQQQRRYRELLEMQRRLQASSGKLSRRIGTAKRNGEPVAGLIQSMQEASGRLRDVNKRLDETRCRILDFFASGADDGSVAYRQPEPLAAGWRSATRDSGNKAVTITLLDDEIGEWNTYVRDHPDTSIYHRAEWRDLIRKTFGHQGAYYIARDHDRNIVGILPLIRLQSRLFGDFMVSMPYFNYGGAIADHAAIESKLMDLANDQAARLGVSHIEYRDVTARAGLVVRTDKVNMILELPDSADSLWSGFSAKLRSQIRRPLRESPGIFSGGSEYLDDFYAVFARNMRDLGTPVYNKAFFGNILDCFPDDSRIVLVRLGGRPVAAGFLLGHRDMLEIPWASSIRDVNHLSMNMLLYWEVLKLAVQEGYRRFDFGRSSKNSGTFRFKRQWGAQPRQLYWHYWLGAGRELPSINPENPKYSLAIKLWKRLPLTISNRLGPLIVRNIP